MARLASAGVVLSVAACTIALQAAGQRPRTACVVRITNDTIAREATVRDTTARDTTTQRPARLGKVSAIAVRERPLLDTKTAATGGSVGPVELDALPTDGIVLSIQRLPPEWAARFRALAVDTRSLPHDSLAKYARPEVAPQYHERLQSDWRKRIRANVK